MSEHWLLLLLLVPLIGPLLKLASGVVTSVWAVVVGTRVVLVAWDVGIEMRDLARAENFHDKLLLIQRKVATETSLLWWRMIRLAQKAQLDGMDLQAAGVSIADMEYCRDANSVSGSHASFCGSTLPDNHPLACRYPQEAATFNNQMQRLQRASKFCQQWLWYARQVRT